MLNKYCMVRTKNSGVFAGTLVSIKKNKAILTDARRIWRWYGAASLSQLATDGTSQPEKCKFPIPVEKVLLFDVIEIIEITEMAKMSISRVPVWEA